MAPSPDPDRSGSTGQIVAGRVRRVADLRVPEASPAHCIVVRARRPARRRVAVAEATRCDLALRERCPTRRGRRAGDHAPPTRRAPRTSLRAALAGRGRLPRGCPPRRRPLGANCLACGCLPRACLRCAAAVCACAASARCDAALCGSRFSACVAARDRVLDGFVGLRCPASYACVAARLVVALPRFGGRSGTPARRAFDNPIAIACFADRAPCLPSRMWSISSRTNSPAAVDALRP